MVLLEVDAAPFLFFDATWLYFFVWLITWLLQALDESTANFYLSRRRIVASKWNLGRCLLFLAIPLHYLTVPLLSIIRMYGESAEKGLRNFVLKLDISSPVYECNKIKYFHINCVEVGDGIKCSLISSITISNSWKNLNSIVRISKLLNQWIIKYMCSSTSFIPNVKGYESFISVLYFRSTYIYFFVHTYPSDGLYTEDKISTKLHSHVSMVPKKVDA